MPDVYRRRITTDEEKEGYLFVEKARLAFFPPEGEPFRVDGRQTAVRSHPCSCRGPARPHRHWLVPLTGLRHGETVELTRTAAGAYTLTRL